MFPGIEFRESTTFKQEMYNRVAGNQRFSSDGEGPGIPGYVFGFYSVRNRESLRVIWVRGMYPEREKKETTGM